MPSKFDIAKMLAANEILGAVQIAEPTKENSWQAFINFSGSINREILNGFDFYQVQGGVWRSNVLNLTLSMSNWLIETDNNEYKVLT